MWVLSNQKKAWVEQKTDLSWSRGTSTADSFQTWRQHRLLLGSLACQPPCRWFFLARLYENMSKFLELLSIFIIILLVLFLWRALTQPPWTQKIVSWSLHVPAPSPLWMMTVQKSDLSVRICLMPRRSIWWDLCFQNSFWVALEKMCVESEGKSFLFTFTCINLFLSLVSSLGRKMFYFVWIAKVEETW